MPIRPRGFSLVEMLVAISILAILSSLVTIVFSSARRNSRDGRRKADVETITGAFSQYMAVSGTTHMTYPSATCTLPVDVNTAPIGSAAAGCVGATGRSYGKLNLGSSVVSGGYATYPGRTYMSRTIGEALSARGLLTTVPKDPLRRSATNSVTEPDYVVIRGLTTTCTQDMTSRSDLVAVWTSLENTPTAEDVGASSKYVGGSASGQSSYVYDFAAQQSDLTAGTYTTKGFAAGNGVNKAVSSGVSSCP
ncbi:MAG TPA: type II secretion system protein [Verrucomicrobiae bacterium]|nr:type II secretion system protein [Verrucomicrobiae bacterium]